MNISRWSPLVVAVSVAAQHSHHKQIVASRAVATIPIHTADPDPQFGPYGVWAAGGAFKASFHDGFTFVPYLGAGYPATRTLSWRTVSVEVGDELAVDVRSPRPAQVGRARYEYRFDGFVEAYDVRTNGVEQTFTLFDRPSSGDLRVTGRIDSSLAADPRAGHGPVVFRDPAGREIVSYGAAFVLDATGDKLPISTHGDGDTITLTVPAEWLATAVFPITIDPVVSRALINFGASNVSHRDVLQTDVAYDPINDQYLIAATRAASATDRDGWFLIRDGETRSSVATAYFDLATTTSVDDPTCAFAHLAQTWVGAFTRTNGLTSSVRYFFHPAGGTTTTTTTHAVPSLGSEQDSKPDLGGTLDDGTARVLLVWARDNTRAVLNTANTNVHGMSIDAATQTAAPPFVVPSAGSSTRLDREFPRTNQTSARGLGWMVVYQQYDNALGNGGDWRVVGERFDARGNRIGGSRWVNSRQFTPRHKLRPVVAGHDGVYTIVYGEVPLGSKTIAPNALALHADTIHWHAGNGSWRRIGDCEIDSVATPTLILGDLAYDGHRNSIALATYHDAATGLVLANRIGGTGGSVERMEVWNTSGEAGSATSVTTRYLDGTLEFDEYLVAFGTEGTTGRFDPVYASTVRHSAARTVGYGTECNETTISAHGAPYAGNREFAVEVRSQRATPAALLIGLTPANTPLDSIGMPDCSLFIGVSLATIPTSTDDVGRASIGIPLQDCRAQFADLFFQWAVITPAVNALGVSASDALRAEIR